MAIITAKSNIHVPETDLLTYIFDSCWKETQGFNDDEPLIVPCVGLDSPPCSFNELRHLTKCFSSGFQKIARPGARVVVYGMLDVYLLVVILGAIGAEASCHICPAYDAVETEARLKSLKADFIFFPVHQSELVHRAAAGASIPEENLFLLDSKTTQSGGEETRIRHWSSLLDFKNGPSFEWRHLMAEEVKNTTALYIHSSGSTGLPKLAEWTHFGLVGNIESYLDTYHKKERPQEQTFLCTFPYAGFLSIVIGLLATLKARYRSVYMPSFNVDNFLSTMGRHKPTALIMPKFHMQALLDHTHDTDFSSVDSVLTGAAMIPATLREAWTERYGSKCLVAYGMTEAGIFTISDPQTPNLDSSVGNLLANQQLKIADAASDHILKKGECGEIFLSSKFAMMKGYLDNETATKLDMVDGWLKTGDLGRVDDQGHIYLVGRIKDMFKHNAVRVMAPEIEGEILKHPDILDACVVRVNLPDSNDTEDFPFGFLVRKQGSTINIHDFLRWMDSNVPGRMTLCGGARFLNSMPVSLSGKIDRRALMERAASEVDNKLSGRTSDAVIARPMSNDYVVF